MNDKAPATALRETALQDLAMALEAVRSAQTTLGRLTSGVRSSDLSAIRSVTKAAKEVAHAVDMLYAGTK